MFKTAVPLISALVLTACDPLSLFEKSKDDEQAAVRSACTIDSTSYTNEVTEGSVANRCFLHLRNGEVDTLLRYSQTTQICPESYIFDRETHWVATGEVSAKCVARHSD